MMNKPGNASVIREFNAVILLSHVDMMFVHHLDLEHLLSTNTLILHHKSAQVALISSTVESFTPCIVALLAYPIDKFEKYIYVIDNNTFCILTLSGSIKDI